MLKYLLIIIVVALALAPLGHFIPSKRQRAQARMREYAALHGMFVEFRDPPSRDGSHVAVRDVIYYGMRLPHRRARPIDSAAWLRTQEGWRSVGRRLPVPAPVQDLSMEINAVSVDQSSCGVYWTESTGEAGVEHVRQILVRWCEELIH